jgi:hypothetical protein
MLEKIKKAFALIRKAPLLFLVPGAALVLSLIAYLDPMGVYAGYNPGSALEPLFVRVLKDAGEDLPSATPENETMMAAGENPVADETADEITDATGEDPAREEAPEQELAAATKKAEAGENNTDAAGGSEGESAKQTADVKNGAGADSKGHEGTAGEAEEAEEAKGSERGEEEESAPKSEPELDFRIPAESTCEVCPAKDYGLANPIYMAPEGWEPVEDTTGYFATNGYYRTPHEVDKEYFSDALFIGDSRVDGLCDYGGLSEYATFLCKDSLTIYKLFSEAMRYRDPYGGKGYKSLGEVLDGRHFHKIYLQIGVNELGTGSTAEFYEAYRNAVATIKTKQPTAIIYIEGIMHVTGARSSSDSVFTNSLVVDKNKAIATLANGRDIFYLDPNPAVCDDNGNLRSDLSMDHAHLKAKSHIYWTEFLMQKAADPEEPAAPVYLPQ